MRDYFGLVFQTARMLGCIDPIPIGWHVVIQNKCLEYREYKVLDIIGSGTSLLVENSHFYTYSLAAGGLCFCDDASVVCEGAKFHIYTSEIVPRPNSFIPAIVRIWPGDDADVA